MNTAKPEPMTGTTLPMAITAPLTSAQKAQVINLVRRAARTEILPRFRNLSSADITRKTSALDIVTRADSAAEAMIARGLARLFPNALIVGEEAVAHTPDLRHRIHEAEMAIVVDPVDGTWNFAHGLPLFGVILSVCRFGQPVLGLLYEPLMDDWIIADTENPAELVMPGGRRRGLATSPGGALSDLSGYIHLYLMPAEQQPGLAATLPEFARILMLRCSCHEYRTVAQGGMDFILSGMLNPWDHAAGVLICQRAGGVARMLDGRDYNTEITEGYLLTACNEATWQAVRDRMGFLLADAVPAADP